MKTGVTLLFFIALNFATMAQAPLKFNYQGIARNGAGSILANQDIGLYLSIHAPVLTGAAVYAETQEVTTNAFGLFTVQMGAGTVVSGSMAAIAWATEAHYLKVELDATGGTDYVFMGGSQLISVPYALYAESSGTPGPVGATGPTGPTGAFTLLQDADSDTKIQVEESADEDIIRFDIEGTEQWVMKGARLENKNSGRSVFIGSLAGRDDDLSNNWNVAVGHNAFVNNTTGGRNVAVGYGSMNLNISGYGNSAFGRGALANNITGNGNVAIGIHALYENTERSGLVAIGDSALYNTGIGDDGDPYRVVGNTAIGSKALFANTIGRDNTAIGYNALKNTSFSTSNVAVGAYTMAEAISGGHNTAVGLGALRFNEASFNVAIGTNALEKNTSGDQNTAVGNIATHFNTTGRGNSSFGYRALGANTTGDYNVAIGSSTMAHSHTGSRNTALGNSSSWTFGLPEDFDNTTALGYFTPITGSNMVRLGSNTVTSIGGFANWTNVSDTRFKVDVKEQVPGLAFISKLRPVTYYLDMDAIAEFSHLPDSLRLLESEKLKAAELQVGFIAQEVEAAAKELNFDFHGVDAPKNEYSYYGLRYAEFVPSLVKAVQELSEENKHLKTRFDEKDRQFEMILKELQLLKKQ